MENGRDYLLATFLRGGNLLVFEQASLSGLSCDERSLEGR